MKQFMGRWILPTAMAWAMAIVPALGVVYVAKAQPVQQSADPATVFLAFDKVVFGPSHDIDAAIVMLTNDAVVRIAPSPLGTTGVFTGKE